MQIKLDNLICIKKSTVFSKYNHSHRSKMIIAKIFAAYFRVSFCFRCGSRLSEEGF